MDLPKDVLLQLASNLDPITRSLRKLHIMHQVKLQRSPGFNPLKVVAVGDGAVGKVRSFDQNLRGR